jgi:outer membrane protein OmpA-like peptidoglycan-associated protein
VPPTPAPPAPAPPPAPAVAATVSRPAAEVKPPVAEPRPRIAAKVNTVHDEVYFSLGSAQLDAQNAAIARIVRWLAASSDVQVTIEGHADPTGTHEGNLALAQKRAEWLRDQLVAGGIDQGRLDVISYGDTRLRYGRADRRNRRAAVVVK